MSDWEREISAWWWSEIGNRENASARGLAARLRRASSALDVAAEPQVHALAQRLGRSEGIVGLAQVLAEVREGRGGSLAKRLGPGLRDPAMSNVRFERLLRSEGDALIAAVRRALPLVNRSCDVGRLGADLLRWDERTRVRWTFEYYGTDMPRALIPSDAEEETTV